MHSAPRPWRSPLASTEKEVSDAVVAFMEAHGWRAVRTQWAAIPGVFSTGEKGMPDYLFIRYMPMEAVKSRSLVLWIEFKSPTDKRKCECLKLAQRAVARKRKPKLCHVCRQREWADAERAKGGVVFDVSNIEYWERIYATYYGWLHRDGAPQHAIKPAQLELL